MDERMLDRCNCSCIAYHHDRHAGKYQGFCQQSCPLFCFLHNLIDIIEQLIRGIYCKLAAGRAAYLIIYDVPDDPIRFRYVFSKHVSDTRKVHIKRRFAHDIDIAHDDIGTYRRRVDLKTSEQERGNGRCVTIHGRSRSESNKGFSGIRGNDPRDIRYAAGAA